MQLLSPPWYTYQKKVKALFKADENVTVSELEGKGVEYKLTLTVNEKEEKKGKAYAIKSILQSCVEYGNIRVDVDVFDENGEIPTPIEAAPELLVETAFTGNSLFKKTFKYHDAPMLENYIYCVFAKEIIQFFNDNIADYKGNLNEMVADVARDICVPDIYGRVLSYCTLSE